MRWRRHRRRLITLKRLHMRHFFSIALFRFTIFLQGLKENLPKKTFKQKRNCKLFFDETKIRKKEEERNKSSNCNINFLAF